MNTSGAVILSEPGFIRTPFIYLGNEGVNINGFDNEQPDGFFEEQTALILKRDISSEEILLDNLIDLIVYTPRGSFPSDPDFGFEFWNHEYKNINYNSFNNGQGDQLPNGKGQKITKKECKESIKNSLETYVPQLKNIHVDVKLEAVPYNQRRKNNTGEKDESVSSKHCISIFIKGERSDGVKNDIPYERTLVFFIEPVAKKRTTFSN